MLDIDKRDINMLFNPLTKYVSILNRAVKQNNEKVVEKFLNKIQKLKKFKVQDQTILTVKKFSSADLRSTHAQVAHEKNPVEIYVGFPQEQSFYSPLNDVIFLGMPIPLFDFLEDRVGFQKLIKNKYKTTWENLISEREIKLMIRHELTHWIDDTLRNFHITKKIINRTLTGRDGDSVPSHEVEAIVHQVQELKREFGDKWEDLSWSDFLEIAPDIKLTLDEVPLFLKPLIKRMNREGFLTKKMSRTMKK